MGELIEFRKDRKEVWSDSGEDLPEEESVDSPRLRLLMLPILLFLDVLAAFLALMCRPISGCIALFGGLALWVGLRDLIRLDPFWSLIAGLGIWLLAHALDYDLDWLIRYLETEEAELMRSISARSKALGRVLHLTLYLYVALAPGLVLALATGVLRLPNWVPPSLHGNLAPDAGLPVLLAALPLAVTAIAMRYRWHPIARHATLDGRRRKLTLAA